MALKQVDPKNLPADFDGIFLQLNNGDLKAVTEAKDKWHFRNIEDVIRYALAVIAQSDSSVIYIKKGGEKVALAPSENLLEKSDEGELL